MPRPMLNQVQRASGSSTRRMAYVIRKVTAQVVDRRGVMRKDMARPEGFEPPTC